MKWFSSVCSSGGPQLGPRYPCQEARSHLTSAVGILYPLLASMNICMHEYTHSLSHTCEHSMSILKNLSG